MIGSFEDLRVIEDLETAWLIQNYALTQVKQHTWQYSISIDSIITCELHSGNPC